MRLPALLTRRKKTALAVAVAVVVVGVAPRLPKAGILAKTPFSHAIVDRDGALLRLTLANDDRLRLRVRLDEIDPLVVEATLEKEDRYFFVHPGVNPVALTKAAVDTWAHGRPRGASTITMQLARLLEGRSTKTASAKARQIAHALWLELRYSKSEILEAYLTLAPYGGNVEGAAAASWVHFGKDARRLTAAEAAALASLPQDPRRAVAWDGAAFRRSRMEVGARLRVLHPELSIADVDVDAAKPTRALARTAHHFVEQVRADAAPEEALVKTTLSGRAQRAVEGTVKKVLEERKDDGIKNAAILVIDRESGDVLVQVGSADAFDASIDGQVDGTRAKRSPGSTLKPFVYGLALDRGLIHTESLLVDEPTRFGSYNPENNDGRFAGPLSARQALIASRNVPAVDLLRRLTPTTLHELLREGGVEGLRVVDHYGLSLVLGGAEVSLQELVALYGALGSGGTRFSLRHRQDVDGGAAAASPRLLSTAASALVLRMLAESPRPQAHADLHFERSETEVAFKTGTSWGFRDAWTVGVVGDLVVGVWVGNFDGSSNGAFVGRTAAAPLFFRVLGALQAEMPERFARPLAPLEGLEVSSVEVCAQSGALPGPDCPHTRRAMILPGRSPVDTCQVHRHIHVDAAGRRTCRGEGGSRVVEVWPAALLEQFRSAGLPRAALPPPAPGCDEDVPGSPPRIVEPQKEIAYVVDDDGRARVPLVADADGEVARLTWFVDDRVAAQGTPRQEWNIDLDAGEHVVRVVDDVGRADGVVVRVAMP